MTRRLCLAATAAYLLVLSPPLLAQRVMENLGRGLMAMRTGNAEVYLGWRALANDPADAAYNLYRSTGGAAPVRVNSAPITQTSDFVDRTADLAQANTYSVRALVDGVEQPTSGWSTLAANTPVRQYLDVPLTPPQGGTATCQATTSAYTYEANDGSIGDLDGDGQYEIILKWYPSNAQDNANSGCTGPTILEGIKLDGTSLWKINLGPNIRSGAHYTQFMVYDLDSDGKAEIAVRTADATVDGQGKTIGDAVARYADSSGFIYSGPEFLTIFDGATGAERVSVPFDPARGDPYDWGLSSNGRPERTNRVDRFLAAVAYLDGIHPSVVMARGYYEKTQLAAWDFRDGKLTRRWFFNSHAPEYSTVNSNGRTLSIYDGQGNHSLSVADVDGDRFDEIVYGSIVIDHDGTPKFAPLGLGHGDAMHVSRFDPNNPDMLVYGVHELGSLDAAACNASANPQYGTTLYNARTGELVMYTDKCYKRDAGRGMAAALDPGTPGTFFWGGASPGGLVNVRGTRVGNAPASTNFALWWDADLLRELEDANVIRKYDLASGSTPVVLTCEECSGNNGTKNTPVLAGDIFGDWREEVIWRTSDNRHLRIYTTTIPAQNRFCTFLQDSQYRLALVWQNVAYNQPPWPSFYVGPGMAAPPRPEIVTPANISATIAGKMGPANSRVWSIEVTNTGTAIANQTMIQSLNLSQMAGTECTPVVQSVFPILVGNVAPGDIISADVAIDFGSCPLLARFKATIPLSAMNGAATSLLVRNHQFR